MTITLKNNTKLPGPFQNYTYGAFIKGPKELGMESEVSGMGIDTIGKNFGYLVSYIELLVSGTSEASKAAALNYEDSGLVANQPLGNAYFFNTGFQCKDSNGNMQNIVSYINNIPLGNIPFISGFMGGGDMQELRGILPGLFEDLNGFNPMIIVDALDICNGMPCNTKVETDELYQLPVTNLDSDGKKYKDDGSPPVEYKNLYTVDPLLKNIDPCLFRGKKHPLTADEGGGDCVESFANINNKLKKDIDDNLNILNNLTKNDWIIQLYYISISILIIFILLKIFNKNLK